MTTYYECHEHMTGHVEVTRSLAIDHARSLSSGLEYLIERLQDETKIPNVDWETLARDWNFLLEEIMGLGALAILYSDTFRDSEEYSKPMSVA